MVEKKQQGVSLSLVDSIAKKRDVSQMQEAYDPQAVEQSWDAWWT
jgi:hypothetical protein